MKNSNNNNNNNNNKFKVETEKVNKLLTNILTCNISELKELIYEGAKLVCDKISVPQRNLDRNKKPGWEIKLEVLIKKLRQQAKVLKKEKHTRICWDKKKTKTAGKSEDITKRDKSKHTGKRGMT